MADSGRQEPRQARAREKKGGVIGPAACRGDFTRVSCPHGIGMGAEAVGDVRRGSDHWRMAVRTLTGVERPRGTGLSS
jgi:hypothetical protein